MRLNVFVLVVALFVLGMGVFSIADKVQIAEKKLDRIEKRIAREQESLRVLNAEWTYLTSPSRLEKLAVSHLSLGPTDGRQYIELAAIPMRDFIEQQMQAEETSLVSGDPMTHAQPVALPRPVESLPVLKPMSVSAVAGDMR